MKKHLRNILISLYVVAITLIFMPFAKEIIQNTKVHAIKTVYRNSPNKLEVIPFEAVQPPNISNSLELDRNVTYNIIGEILIPTLELTVELFPGISDELLLLGASVLYPERKAEEDSLILLGHHLTNEELLFGKLLKLKSESTIYLRYYDRLYEYTVMKIEEVNETDLSVLANTRKGVLRLITCPEPTRTEKRLVVTAHMTNRDQVNQESFSSQRKEYKYLSKQKLLKRYKIIVIVFVIILLVGITLIISLFKNVQ